MKVLAFKCKMCGGYIELVDEKKVYECKCCGSKQTVSSDNENVLDIVNRANGHRNKCEFAEAESDFKTLIADYPDEAEGYWGLCLCKYGVTYETNGETTQRYACCHKTSMDNIFEDINFKKALELCDDEGKEILRGEAEVIDQMQIDAFKRANFNTSCDVAICYVEKDSEGLKTSDSVLAQKIYAELVDVKIKAVLLNSGLRERIGSAYDGYAISTVSSAKVLVAVGTSNSNFYADEMRTLWGQFIDEMYDNENKTLMVVFKEMYEEDLPAEFEKAKKYDAKSHGGLKELYGDVEHCINSIRRKEKNKAYMSTASTMIEKGFDAIEGKDWGRATEILDKAINIYPKSSRAYFGKFLVNQKLREKDAEKTKFRFSLMEDENFQTAHSLATGKEKALYEKMLRNNSSLIERAYMWLNDGEFTEATRLASQELINNPESSQAYLCKFLASRNYKSFDAIYNANIKFILQNDDLFKRAYLYANDEEKAKLDKLIAKNKNVVEKENLRYEYNEKKRKPYVDKYKKLSEEIAERQYELRELEAEALEKQKILSRLEPVKMFLLALVLIAVAGGICFGIVWKYFEIALKISGIAFGISAFVIVVFVLIYGFSGLRKRKVERNAFRKFKHKSVKYTKEIEKFQDELIEVGDVILCATCGNVKKTTHGHCKVCDSGAWFRVRYIFTDPEDCRRHMVTSMPTNYDFLAKEISEEEMN